MVNRAGNTVSAVNELACPHAPLLLPTSVSFSVSTSISTSISTSLSGVRIVAGAVGDLASVLDSHQLGAALGGLEDLPSSATSSSDNTGGDGDLASDVQDKVKRSATNTTLASDENTLQDKAKWSDTSATASR